MIEEEKIKAGLKLLRVPFPANQVLLLAKASSKQNEDKAGFVNCRECGGYHHKNAAHLSYVGHAALTDRLLEVDPLWNWNPMSVTDEGLPRFDASGGLWIRLTILGHTRLGYGHAAASQYKEIGAREKEVIGDALRNAAMRFGAALDLWHKGDLHAHLPQDDAGDDDDKKGEQQKKEGENKESGAGEEELKSIISLCKELKVDPKRVCARYGVNGLNELNKENAKEAKTALENTKKGREQGLATPLKLLGETEQSLILSLCTSLSMPQHEIAVKYGVSEISQLPLSKFGECVAYLEDAQLARELAAKASKAEGGV